MRLLLLSSDIIKYPTEVVLYFSLYSCLSISCDSKQYYYYVHSQPNKDQQWARAMEYVNGVPELNYMTQIVIMMYEDPTKVYTIRERVFCFRKILSGLYAFERTEFCSYSTSYKYQSIISEFAVSQY